MANFEKASAHSVHGNHDAAATVATSAITVRGARLADVSVAFLSTTGGSVVLQRETLTTPDAETFTWRDIETYTGDTEKVIRSGSTRKYRYNITVTDGEIAFELTAGNKE